MYGSCSIYVCYFFFFIIRRMVGLLPVLFVFFFFYSVNSSCNVYNMEEVHGLLESSFSV